MERYLDEELTAMLHDLESKQEERILSEKRQSKNVPFDLRPVYQATIKDLSRSYFEDKYLPMAFAIDILEANTRSYEERLAACKMIVSADDTTPTFLGLMAIEKNRVFILAERIYNFYESTAPTKSRQS